MSKYSDRCKTCKHWTKQGVDDWDYGSCYLFTDWSEVIIHGDAWAEVEISPSFGCVLHEAEEVK